MSETFKNLTGPAITLPQMLATRDWRAAQQRQLLTDHPMTSLIWASVRIPGPIKTGPQLVAGYQAMQQHLLAQLGDRVVAQASFDRPTGYEFYIVAKVDALEVKQALMQLEQSTAFSQLADLDVLTLVHDQLHQVSRTGLALPVRPCLICGGDAKACSRSRRHGLAEVQQAVDTIITEGWRAG